MKKAILSFAILLVAGAAFAQEHKVLTNPATPVAPVAPVVPSTTLKPDNVQFTADSYDFGTIEEGPAAEHIFTFTNTGSEDLVVQRVQPSCGCTTPDWTKDPIPPHKTGMIKASYGT